MCELILIRSGKGSYTVEGRHYPLKKNALVITHPRKLHRIHIESDEQPYERNILMYDPQRLLPELYEAIPKNLDILYLGSNHPVVDIFQRMDACCQQLQGAERERLMSILAEEVFFYVRLYAGQSAEPKAGRINPVIQKAIAYIDENIATLSSVEEVSNALFVTKGHLHHLFNEQMQITPKKYVISKRLSLARQAIRAGAKPTQIYTQYGFNSYAAFYRDYKQFYGYSPSEESSMPNIPDIPYEQI